MSNKGKGLGHILLLMYSTKLGNLTIGMCTHRWVEIWTFEIREVSKTGGQYKEQLDQPLQGKCTLKKECLKHDYEFTQF